MKKRIESLLRQLTLEEKIGMIHGAGLFRTEGVPRLGIPPLRMSDGPMGVRPEFQDEAWINCGNNDDMVSYLPCNSAIASTWNLELARDAGRTLGREARGRGKDVILAPGINIKRSPLCGRNFEYMSEDPFLTAELAEQVVLGIQENDVAACPKHFAANGQETDRFQVDTIVDERTLQELYFPAFRRVVDAGAMTIMGAYNRLNGEHCCTSPKLLGDVLREQWGFNGTIISDWGGVHDTLLAANSPLDIEMDIRSCFDAYYMAAPLLEKVRSGEVSEAKIDSKVRHVLELMAKLKMLPPESEQRSCGAYNDPRNRQSALEVAQNSVILLKNENILPLNRKKLRSVAVIGANAARQHSHGGGSAEIRALYELTPLMGIRMLMGGNTQVSYAAGYVIPQKQEVGDVNWQADSTTDPQTIQTGLLAEESLRHKALEEALCLAKDADAVIFVGGLDHDYDVEGQDRRDMKLPYGQNEVLEALLELRPDTAVVMYAGSPVEMPWLPKAKALLWSYYNGMEGGYALAQILFGQVNPSGHLAESMPASLDQCPANASGQFGTEGRVEYTDGLMVGYRYYDTAQVPVNFCFGHGLSYSTFHYRNLRVAPDADGWNILLDVCNESDIRGREVVQLYAAPQETADVRPAQELKAFASVCLEPWEKKTVQLHLSRRNLTRFCDQSHAWIIDAGRYELRIGASSRDIRLTAEILCEEEMV